MSYSINGTTVIYSNGSIDWSKIKNAPNMITSVANTNANTNGWTYPDAATGYASSNATHVWFTVLSLNCSVCADCATYCGGE